MKLRELLFKLADEGKIPELTNDGITYKEDVLEKIKDDLLKCDQFRNVIELKFMMGPFMEDLDGKPFTARTCRLTDDYEFVGHMYLYSIWITPAIFDPKTMRESVKDGVCITPLYYDMDTYEPRKQICVDMISGEFDNIKNKSREELVELFNRALDNPDEYLRNGIHHVFVRGKFEISRKNDW